MPQLGPVCPTRAEAPITLWSLGGFLVRHPRLLPALPFLLCPKVSDLGLAVHSTASYVNSWRFYSPFDREGAHIHLRTMQMLQGRESPLP